LTGTVVVLDIFRASNTLIALLGHGVKETLLVADLEEARALKRSNPAWLLFGERGGITPEDFDGGNSPANVGRVARPGDTVILTTSAGTQAVARLERAARVFFASFANAAAVVGALQRLDEPMVTLLPMGLEAREPAVEDDEAAAWIARSFAGKKQDFGAVRRRVLDSDGARRLRRLDQEDDLRWCTRLDAESVIPWVVAGDPPRAVFYRPGMG
jgi:2-phosphosulfolactate phosphatase